jgi:hypothetical protein
MTTGEICVLTAMTMQIAILEKMPTTIIVQSEPRPDCLVPLYLEGRGWLTLWSFDVTGWNCLTGAYPFHTLSLPFWQD